MRQAHLILSPIILVIWLLPDGSLSSLKACPSGPLLCELESMSLAYEATVINVNANFSMGGTSPMKLVGDMTK